MKQSKTYNVAQCALYKCTNQRRLERLLKLGKYELKHISKIIGYYSFKIDKKGTTEKRMITAPTREIKQVQSRVLKLLQPIERPHWLISGEKGKCYIQNGEAHINSKYMLTIDIKKFYDNCKREYVFRFFCDYLKTSGDIAGILTNIVTYELSIPTGCPTSQIIAYYAYMNMFEEINTVSKKYNCIFTLYVDDMTFSSGVDFQHKKLKNEIDIILRKYGHKPNYKKVKYYSTNDMKPVTGTIITPINTLTVPNSLQKKVYQSFQDIKPFILGAENAHSVDLQKKIISLRGQLNAVNRIEGNMFPEINRLTTSMILSQNNSSKLNKKEIDLI